MTKAAKPMLGQQAKKTKRDPVNSANTDKDENHENTITLDIGRISNSFILDVNSIRLSMKLINKSLMEHLTTETNYFLKYFDGLRDKNDKITIEVDKISDFERRVKRFSISVGAAGIVNDALLLRLVGKWDSFIELLIRWIHNKHPEILRGSERTISYSELFEINDVIGARDKLLDEEVGAVIRESHAHHFSYISKKIGRKLEPEETLWRRFIELTQRRHLFAHSDGHVSAQYIKVCKENGVNIPANLKRGSKLKITQLYIEECCDCLIRIATLMSQVIWRTIENTDDSKERADSSLVSITFDLIENEQYATAVGILEFAIKPPFRFFNEANRRICVINLAQAYKWAGEDEKCRSTLDLEDWTASSLKFSLATAVLKDDFTNAAACMRQIGRSGEIERENYDKWPLFKKFRKTDEFRKCYKEIFSVDFETIEIPEQIKKQRTRLREKRG